MSLSRAGAYFNTYIGDGQDPGGTIYNDNGTVFRDAPIGSNDGYTSVVFIGPGTGLPNNRVRANDLIVLCHIVSKLNTAGLGQPTNVNNPWNVMYDVNGYPVNYTASGPTGSLRLRMWWKWATLEDAIIKTRYSLTNSFASQTNIFYAIIPRESFATDPAYDDPLLGNGHYPAPYVPVAMNGRSGSGGNPYAPPIITPNVGNKYRNLGIHGAVYAHSNSDKSYDIYNTGGITYEAGRPEPTGPSPYFTPVNWAEVAGYLGPAPAAYGGTGASGYMGWTQVKLDGRYTEAYYDYSNYPTVSKMNDAFISLTLSVIKPYDYPAPTPDKTTADWRDTFETGALTDKWALGTTRSDQSLPTVVDGKLRLLPDQQILHRYRVDLTGKSVVIGPIDYPQVTESGNNFWFTLNSAIADVTHHVQIAMFTKGSANGAEIRWSLLDEGFFANPAAPGDPRSLVGYWDPVKTRYWRIREGAGVLRFETSPDKLRWRGTTWGHFLLPDQMRSLQIHMYVLGDGQVTIDEVQPVVPPDLRSIPYEESWAFMGAGGADGLALRERYHGRDVLAGIADQGSTQAVRTAQNVTLTRRTYVIGAPGDNKEIFDYATHGCLVMPCMIPPGGKFAEAVISGTDGSSTPSIMMSGLVWLARQGCRVLNISFGGGSDDPIFDAGFAYIAAGFDCQIFISAGNDYAYGISIPAAYSVRYGNVHSVIAFDEATNQRSVFSNHHELASGCAPGSYVGGRLPDGSPVLWNGTSASAPHAAGLCVRLITGGRFNAAQAGLALNRNTRPTGQPASEEGGGAFDISRAALTIGDPSGTTNIPAISMPRFDQGEWDGVTDKLNTLIGAVEAQGRACLVRYAARAYDGQGTLVETNASMASNTYTPVPWTSCDADSYGGMWDGSPSIVIPSDGLYLVVVQLRYGPRLADGTVATGAPYTVGQRGAVIFLNGVDENANSITLDRKAASVDADGTTITATALLPLFAEDFLFGVGVHTAGATIQCFQNDYGGNWMLVARIAPLAPDLSGSLLPVTNLTAVSTRYDQVTLAWAPPATDDLLGVLIRRLPGTTAPASITDGAYVDLVKAGKTSFLDTRLASNATYTYGVWAKSPGGYSPRATVTVATSAKPAAPAPVTNITSSRRTTGVISLAWTTPPNPDANGVTRAGIVVRRNEGGNPPTTPEGGVLVATLPPDATGYDDLNVVANGRLYAYSVFTYRAEQVYSTSTTHVRSTAINTSIYGFLRPGDVVASRASSLFGIPIGQTDAVLMPTFTALNYYGSLLIFTYFWVRRPALFKGFRFLRPKPHIGAVKAALFEFEAVQINPFAHRRSPDKTFGQTAAFQTWEEAILTEADGGYIPLTPYQIYINVTQFPSDVGEVSGFWNTGGFGERGLADPNGLLVMPSTIDRNPGDRALWAEALGTYRPVDGNCGGSQYYDPYYEGPIHQDIGGPVANANYGRNFYCDVIVNEL